MRRFVGTAASCGLLVLYAGWVIGQVFRDQNLLTALGFYVPSPVLAAFVLIGCALAFARRERRKACFLLVVAAPVLWTIGLRENQWSVPESVRRVSSPGVSVRVLHWNVNGGIFGFDGVAAEIAAADADLILISESPSGLTWEEVQRRFGEEYFGIRFGRLRAIARSEIGGRDWLYRYGGLQVGTFTWWVGDRPLKVFIVDILANPLVPRNPLLRALRVLIEEHQPDLVIGDFNSPRRCLALDPLPDGWAHAYDLAGVGWSYTWPTPLPVYAIDQAIVRDTIRVDGYRLEHSWLSDHRRQILELTVPDAPIEGGGK